MTFPAQPTEIFTTFAANFKKCRKYMPNTTFKGFAYGAIAAASYGLNPLFALPLYSAGMNPDSVLFYRYGIAVVMLFVLMLVQKQSFALKKAEVAPLVLMGILFSFSSLTLFMSYNYMDAGIASTILFAYPVLVAIIMAVFFQGKGVVCHHVLHRPGLYGHHAALSRRRRQDPESAGRIAGVHFFADLCHLYCGREPLCAARDVYAEAYFLFRTVWNERLYRQTEIWPHTPAHTFGRTLAESRRDGVVPLRLFR